jgi:hypothetical protein
VHFLVVGNNHDVTVDLEGLGGGGTIELEVTSLSFFSLVIVHKNARSNKLILASLLSFCSFIILGMDS